MGETKLRLPQSAVLDTLFKKFAANKENIASINGDLGDRLRTQYENNEHFTPWAWSVYKKIRYVSVSNELKALEMCDVTEEMVRLVRADIQKTGHVGDLAKIAQPKASEAPAEAPAAAAPAPETAKKPRGKKAAVEADSAPEGDSVDKFRAGLKEKKPKGSNVTSIADRHVPAQEKRLGPAAAPAVEKDEFDEADPKKAAPAAMPPIPPELDRRTLKAEEHERTGQGTYKLQ